MQDSSGNPGGGKGFAGMEKGLDSPTILKPEKDAAEIGSYRPVGLTSCVWKWMERIVANRLRARLEGEGKLSEW